MKNLGTVKSEEELTELISKIQKDLPQTSLLLFRGQTILYKEMRSGKGRYGMKIVPELENGWKTIVTRILKQKNRTKEFTQAVLQHYGLPTYFLDLTSNPNIAAWFACNKYTPAKPFFWVGATMRMLDEVSYVPINKGSGYLLILEIPNYEALIKSNNLFDISNEDLFIRAKRQDAYLLLDHSPILPDPNEFWKYTVTIDRSQFLSSKNQKSLFPSPKNDDGYMKLLDVPYAQLPSAYFNEEISNVKVGAFALKAKAKVSAIRDIDKYMVFGRRVIPIPFYTTSKDDLIEFNPKWKDTILYEPSPFRLWQLLKLNLKDGKLSKAIKITMSPDAFGLMLKKSNKIDLAWPDVQSNSIFFTKAEIGHDKIELHSPPYIGTWLTKKDNLIIEHLIFADEDGFSHYPGHAYILEDGNLTPVRISPECDCGKPDDHLPFLTAFLGIHALIKIGKIALVQHPFIVKDWYILI